MTDLRARAHLRRDGAKGGGGSADEWAAWAAVRAAETGARGLEGGPWACSMLGRGWGVRGTGGVTGGNRRCNKVCEVLGVWVVGRGADGVHLLPLRLRLSRLALVQPQLAEHHLVVLDAAIALEL
eukprot:5064025-Prymnesium_polylepis.1